MQNYIISEELANKIITYLANKPYVEVFEVLDQIKTLKKVNIVDEKGGVDNVQSKETSSEESNADDKQAGGEESNGQE